MDGEDDGDVLLGWLLQAGSVRPLPLDTKLCQTWRWLMLIWVNIFSYSICSYNYTWSHSMLYWVSGFVQNILPTDLESLWYALTQTGVAMISSLCQTIYRCNVCYECQDIGILNDITGTGVMQKSGLDRTLKCL